ncbi:MAG: integrin alpha [Anaerolineae bacterium]|nr:integrin alpha [Anaerolineae bacterium]
MQKRIMRFISLWLLLVLAAGAVVWLRPSHSAAANPLSVTGGHCFQVFLPLITEGSAASPTTASSVNGRPDVCARPTAFPDFNGDGYADLVVGVPREDVTDGATYEDAGAVHVIYGTADGLVALAAQAAVDDQLWHRGITGLDQMAIADDDRFGAALAMGDFNSDGYDDLAIGVPGSVVNGYEEAGAVQVLYGTAVGLTLTDTQLWTQDDSLVSPSAAGDLYGYALAAGDFDGDGYADLAVSLPGEMVNGMERAGAVHIIFGSTNGLQSAIGGLNEFLTEDTDPFFGTAEPYDNFGHTLTVGDFDGDGYDDLAVGIPYEDFADGLDNAGNVQIFYGTADAFLDEGSFVRQPQQISANTPGVDNLQETNDYFGYSLTAGDFDGDGYDELVIGVPYEAHGSGDDLIPYAGAVNIVYGAAGGLDPATGAPIWHQGLDALNSEAMSEEWFGWKLTAADFNSDGYADLAIGVPGDKLYDIAIGSTHILHGSTAGITGDGDDIIYDPVNPEALDEFGMAVTAADFNGDGYADLVVGAHHDDPVELTVDNVGSVFVFHSNASGVQQADNQYWYQGYNGLAGAPEVSDGFGSRLP